MISRGLLTQLGSSTEGIASKQFLLLLEALLPLPSVSAHVLTLVVKEPLTKV